ncbi:hypothetical protein VAR608DRAFT_4868 [Variovorax sp. HW608]|uniref:hypothetical protein n=1 Tax=Variovorax sp. HW608 TaxID=1034889 RepID=UPI00081F8342|nr:hypothetical protein [Variovorax sp. HW608]SCK48983.1 hypothetical protein VAR608DRAFT_4868 [Variovorax sp. HW608]
MASIQVAPRPNEIDGCLQSWADHDEVQVVRSSMETGAIKVRRRFTAVVWLVDASVTLDASLYLTFRDWFRVSCQSGVLPTRFKTPWGAEVVMRFTAPPAFDWGVDAGARAFRVSMTLEQMPEWASL